MYAMVMAQDRLNSTNHQIAMRAQGDEVLVNLFYARITRSVRGAQEVHNLSDSNLAPVVGIHARVERGDDETRSRSSSPRSGASGEITTQWFLADVQQKIPLCSIPADRKNGS